MPKGGNGSHQAAMQEAEKKTGGQTMTEAIHNTAFRLAIGLLAVIAVVSLWAVSAQAHHEGPTQTHHEPVEQVHHEDPPQTRHGCSIQTRHGCLTQVHHGENT